MIRAEQERIMHESNALLLEIRHSELVYYGHFYLLMMTQSVLIIGYGIIAMVQIDALDSPRLFITRG